MVARDDLLKAIAVALNSALLVLAVVLITQGHSRLINAGDALLAVILVAAPASALVQMLRPLK